MCNTSLCLVSVPVKAGWLEYNRLAEVYNFLAAQAVQHIIQDAQPAVYATDHHPHPQSRQGLQSEHSRNRAWCCALVQGAPVAEDLAR